MAKLAADTERLIGEFGATDRVWHSEQGTGADGAGYIALGQDEEQCGVNLVQAYLSALGTGVEKFFWFSAQTSPTYGWAVFRENYVPRPRLVALNGLARMLKGRRVTGRMELGQGEVACVLMDWQAGPAAAMWDLRGPATVQLPNSEGVLIADMLGNPITDQTATMATELRLGRPVCMSAPELSADGFAQLLRGAEVKAIFPVRVAAERDGDGTVLLTVENFGASNVDVRASVTADGLFAAPPAPSVILDLAPQQVRTVTLHPDKQPAAGVDVPLAVLLEVGEHGFSQSVTRLERIGASR